MVILVLVLIVPNLSGRYSLYVGYASSVDSLRAANQTMYNQWSKDATVFDDASLHSFPEIEKSIIYTKEHAFDDAGGGAYNIQMNGFEYFYLNSRLGGKLDSGGSFAIYNHDFYIILVTKY